jgi:hypothetical protein
MILGLFIAIRHWIFSAVTQHTTAHSTGTTAMFDQEIDKMFVSLFVCSQTQSYKDTTLHVQL